MTLSRSSDASEIEVSLFQRRVLLADGFQATLQNRFCVPIDSELRARSGLLAISVKNPRFSNALVAAFCRAARERFAGGVVTVVDRPYERNVAAGSGTPDEQQREIETLRRVAAETRARVGRIVAKHGSAVSIKAWDDLTAETPPWLTQAIRAAWERRGRFHAGLLAQSRAILPNEPAPEELERYAEFLLEELPVLLHLYYFRDREVVDVYPGPNPPVFWGIEAGAYADEMPELAHRLSPRGGLVYAHVWLRIRPMRPTDLEAMARVWQRARAQVRPGPEVNVNAATADNLRHFLDVVCGQNEVWLAVDDDNILGFFVLSRSQVNHFFVDSLARRRGIGTALLERAKALSPAGISILAGERNEATRAFYMRRGFREARLVTNSLLGSGAEMEFTWNPRDDGADPPRQVPDNLRRRGTIT
jgi:ribosomal protein S18 acetylase RimI-like enzyme